MLQKMETFSISDSTSNLTKNKIMKHKLYPNPSVLFHLSEDGIVAIDALSKDEFDLTDTYFARLKFWNGQRSDKLNDIDRDLLEGGLVLEQPAADSVWGGDKLSELCHLSMRNPASMIPSLSEEESARQFVELSREKPTELARFQPDVASWIDLPEPDLTKIKQDSLYSSLKNRKTSRDFDGSSITAESLSTVLFASFGYIHGQNWDELAEDDLNRVAERKSSPSGSGVQSCDAFLTVVHVDGIEPGYYFYDAKGHKLGLLAQGCDDAAISHIMVDQFWIKGSACGIFITVDMNRVWYKTPFARAYGYVFLEAGHISQTALLAATSMGLKTWLSGSMRDDFIAHKFGIDGTRLFPVTSVFIGNGSDSAVPARVRDMVLKLRNR